MEQIWERPVRKKNSLWFHPLSPTDQLRTEGAQGHWVVDKTN
jgi:hypothetical protein